VIELERTVHAHADRLARLEARVAELEARLGSAAETPSAAGGVAVAGVDTPDYAALLTQLAVVCFVLAYVAFLRQEVRA